MKRIEHRSIFARLQGALSPWYFHGFVLLVLILLSLVTISYGRSQLYQQLTYETVLIASAHVDEGKKITRDDIATQKFLAGHVPINSYSEKEADDVIGLYTTAPLENGDIIAPHLLSTTQKPILGSTVEKDRYLVFLDSTQIEDVPPHISKDVLISIIGADPKSDKKLLLVSQTKIADTLSDSSKKNTPVVGVGVILTKDEALAVSGALAQKWLLQLIIIGTHENTP